ncbi:Sugar (and other) transporter [Phytophthora infestans]|uniref:Sugar (And other) transporter n=1 Tax=Phytophthora infestans TaxID=4787 RepID=A0A833T2S4_PHYIN|nr:Sugar (and other) transporter [Phytophthora infestans]KAF4150007.1 Sugar (and other) transporter [Phytophthora infestans]
MPSRTQTDSVYSEATTPRDRQRARLRRGPKDRSPTDQVQHDHQYNNTEKCNARPLADDTCLRFPGHSKLEWTFSVNAWIFGGMIGSFVCGHFSNLWRLHWSRKKLLLVSCIFMFAGAVVETSVSNVLGFSAGRLIAGVASGTGTFGAYMNELTPPHMRNILCLSGWRYLAMVLAVLFLLMAPSMCVESPTWLLMKNRREEAKRVLARLYSEENMYTPLSWLESWTKPNRV